MKKEAIILAGGLGTRLSETVPDLPKCMAPVNGIPFISLLIRYLKTQGISDFIFSLGYKNEIIKKHILSHFQDLKHSFSIETSPLGTGGAILKALGYATGSDVCVVNGDTFFDVRLSDLEKVHHQQKADCTLALKPMMNFSRYGLVELGADHLITGFHEKRHYDKGLINGGIYIIRKDTFLKENFAHAFSFEKDYLEKYLGKHRIAGCIQDEYFIDIGIPEDYFRAQDELKIFLQ